MITMVKDIIKIGATPLSLHDVVKVARYGAHVELSSECRYKVIKSREYVERLLKEEKVVYGLTTGFGKFSETFIKQDDAQQLQQNLIRSHACGIGEPLSEEVVRAIMLLRVNALSQGHSGIRIEVLETIVNMLNKKVVPVIPEKGSLGASGDLAPLSHLALVVMGEGEAFFNGQRMSGRRAMELAGISPVILEAKEGLALINGTQVMTAIGALACWDAIQLAQWADCAAALTYEALLGISDAFDKETHELRPHEGQLIVAKNLRSLTNGSSMITRQGELRVQDAYSLRCVPQVHGASRDAIQYVREKLNVEMNSVTDNPLIFHEKDRVISGGNFHGQYIALSMDFLSISVAEYANISERRIERLVNPNLNVDLPAFLTKLGGTNSGFMIAQYAAASLVSENKSLAHPASVDSIPSSANQEDHVSMGTIAARKAAQIVDNAFYVIGIELLCASQGIDLRESGKLGKGTQFIYSTLREKIPYLEKDRVLSSDFIETVQLMKDYSVLEALKNIVTLD